MRTIVRVTISGEDGIVLNEMGVAANFDVNTNEKLSAAIEEQINKQFDIGAWPPSDDDKKDPE